MPALSDHVAIVTGASSGIGEATAKHLATEGATVVLAARREGRLNDLKNAIEADGGTALVVPTDVTDRDAVKALAQRTVDEYGRIDVLVNNAGVMPLTYLHNMQTDDWYSTVDINLYGVLHAIEAVLPTMIEQERGHVVNVSSTAGRKVYPGGAVYSATKYGVRALSEGMRQELGPRFGIRVTCIEPGAVATELTDTISDEELKKDSAKMFSKLTPLEAERIAESIVYAVTAPASATVAEILVMPTDQMR
ncbi:SDR family oxidoreductase [Rubrivirga marina]|uniref:Oxidoreductase n=1 Tax=Rubrivirga marina TaxID=1196024 RepID=A0A271IYI8_9BACT|nr:SDR family oxidoreductase [Rubrivirga marina]PAP75589.1 oxidoreductase [Rubrivirga marina]